jgi:hypothetical protein
MRVPTAAPEVGASDLAWELEPVHLSWSLATDSGTRLYFQT